MKPREFWIDIRDNGDGEVVHHSAVTSFQGELFHVIEYSAYEELAKTAVTVAAQCAAEREKSVLAAERENHWFQKYNRKQAELKAERERSAKLVAALESLRDLQEWCGPNRDPKRIEIAKQALEEYRK